MKCRQCGAEMLFVEFCMSDDGDELAYYECSKCDWDEHFSSSEVLQMERKTLKEIMHTKEDLNETEFKYLTPEYAPSVVIQLEIAHQLKRIADYQRRL